MYTGYVSKANRSKTSRAAAAAVPRGFRPETKPLSPRKKVQKKPSTNPIVDTIDIENGGEVNLSQLTTNSESGDVSIITVYSFDEL